MESWKINRISHHKEREQSFTFPHLPPLAIQSCSLKDISLSVQFSRSVMSDSLQPHELQHTRPPCPSPAPGVYPNPCPSSRWCHPTISSSVFPFSSCPQSFPASGSFQMSQLFASGDQSIRVSASASVLPMNTQDWSCLGWTGWISLQSKGLSRVFSNTTVQGLKHTRVCMTASWDTFISIRKLRGDIESYLHKGHPPSWGKCWRRPCDL